MRQTLRRLLPLPRKCKKCGMQDGDGAVVVAQGCPPLVPYFWGCTRCYPTKEIITKEKPRATVQLQERGFLGDFPRHEKH